MQSGSRVALLVCGPEVSPAEEQILAWAGDRVALSVLRLPAHHPRRGARDVLEGLLREVTYPGTWRGRHRRDRRWWRDQGLPDAQDDCDLLVDLRGDPRAIPAGRLLGCPVVQLQVAAAANWPDWGRAQSLASIGYCPFQIVHSSSGDRETVLKQGAFPTRWSPRATALDIATRAGRQVVTVLDDLPGYLRRSVTLGDARLPAPPPDPQGVPGPVRRAVRMLLTERSRRTAPWHLATVRGPWTSADVAQAANVPNPADGWLADPHWCQWQDQTGLFVEQFDHASGRGHIAWLPWRGDVGGDAQTRCVIATEHHLSFPWTFAVGDRLFMTMESGRVRRLHVYECLEFPTRWRLHCDYLVGVEAADPVIVQRPDGWFLLVNIDSCDSGRPGDELHVFVSDDPLSGRWSAIPGNPQVVDPRCARNGGLLSDDQGMFRVAQQHGFRTYGTSCHVMQILQLDRAGYRERWVRSFAVGGDLGPHTLTGDGDRLFFDVHAPTR